MNKAEKWAAERAWEQDSNNSDNWFKIPDFGVKPSDVNWNGFSSPIVHPLSQSHYELRKLIREKVITARNLISIKFKSIAEMPNAVLQVLDWHEKNYDWHGEVPVRREGEVTGKLSASLLAAFFYDSAIHTLESAARYLEPYGYDYDRSMMLLVDAENSICELALNVATNESIETDPASICKIQQRIKEESRSELARNAVSAKLARDPKQKAKQEVKILWLNWKKHTEIYKNKSAFARDMLDKFETLGNQAVIVRWCTDWDAGRS